jgi:hypothetical protein
MSYSDGYKKGTESTERSTIMADEGMSMNGGWMWVFFLFFLLAWGGNGFGGFGSGAANAALTRAELYEGFNNQTVVRKLDGVTQGICDSTYALNSGIQQGFAGVQRDLCQGFAAVNTGINENRYALQDCCCTTNRNIDALRYENAKNTCDIVRAIEKDGDATRALINANVTQALRDKLVEKDQMLQTANFQLSQQAQSASLIGTLRPFPQPAYITCSPYQTAYFNGNGYGCGGCCNG